MSAKAISPLIATVLLIAFTMAAAAIVFGWGTGFINAIFNPISDKGPKTVQCTYANLDVQKADVVYNFSGVSSSVNVSIYNSGAEDLYNFSLGIITNSGVYTFNPTNQYNETTPLAKGVATLLKAVNSSSGAPAGGETFKTLRITAICQKSDRKSYEVDMT
ncbi:MAG: archaellin/type IV pilin N-terminal domain-containing protein [Candidatus Aenigmatarchaeota archaeon]